MHEHEHQFPEEQTLEGYLQLGPCLFCGLAAADGIVALKNELETATADRSALLAEIQQLRDERNALQSRIDVLEPPAQNYNRMLARAEAAEARAVQAEQELEGRNISLTVAVATKEDAERALGTQTPGLEILGVYRNFPFSHKW